MIRKILITFIGVLLFFLFSLMVVRKYSKMEFEFKKIQQEFYRTRVEVESLKKTREKEELFFKVTEEIIKKVEPLKDRKPNPVNLTPKQIIDISATIINLSAVYEKDGLSPSIILGLIEQESAFDPLAISNARAYGIAQVLESTALPYLKSLGYPEDKNLLFDPVINLQVGIMHLVELHRYWMSYGKETKDDWKLSLHSYFWGTSLTWELLTKKERVNVPGLEYSNSILEKAKNWDLKL